MDEEVVQDGVCVIIDKKAQLTLLGKSFLSFLCTINTETSYRNRNGLCTE